jgi:hypothetical protein
MMAMGTEIYSIGKFTPLAQISGALIDARRRRGFSKQLPRQSRAVNSARKTAVA